ncbi:MAG: PHP domain-containing protein [Candidatus Omnitrophica bacterium]|nr:PHP domain-containing protein [Candidatus Omnitrophota bacterium]
MKDKTRYADLHVHTIFSDGTFTPQEAVDCAISKELACIAICDHDSIDGIEPSVEYAAGLDIEIVPGVEITVLEGGKEMHLLGYFISWHEQWFRDILKTVQTERVKRLEKMIEKLKNFNIKVNIDTVMDISGHVGSVGRLHLARTMVKEGAVSSISEAFNRYIGDSKPCYVEDIGFNAKEAIGLIRKAKGVPVLAHPAVIGNDEFVHEFIKHGLRGIEVFHSDHSLSVSRKYERLARENNLLITGGSDCHGMGKGSVLMGNIKVPYSIVEALKEEALSRRKREG